MCDRSTRRMLIGQIHNRHPSWFSISLEVGERERSLSLFADPGEESIRQARPKGRRSASDEDCRIEVGAEIRSGLVAANL